MNIHQLGRVSKVPFLDLDFIFVNFFWILFSIFNFPPMWFGFRLAACGREICSLLFSSHLTCRQIAHVQWAERGRNGTRGNPADFASQLQLPLTLNSPSTPQLPFSCGLSSYIALLSVSSVCRQHAEVFRTDMQCYLIFNAFY